MMTEVYKHSLFLGSPLELVSQILLIRSSFFLKFNLSQWLPMLAAYTCLVVPPSVHTPSSSHPLVSKPTFLIVT